jgi:lysozyme
MDQPADVQRALANMVYQLGVRGLLGFRNMLSALRAGDRLAAADHCLDSEYARQTPERALRVAHLLGGESWVGPS